MGSRTRNKRRRRLGEWNALAVMASNKYRTPAGMLLKPQSRLSRESQSSRRGTFNYDIDSNPRKTDEASMSKERPSYLPDVYDELPQRSFKFASASHLPSEPISASYRLDFQWNYTVRGLSLGDSPRPQYVSRHREASQLATVRADV